MAQGELFPDLGGVNDLGGSDQVAERTVKYSRLNSVHYEPPNLGKAIRLRVPNFNDPHRPLVCLEVDFPIAPVNALSSLEGNAGKPIYQMSKWWARRRSSVFRSLLIAAAVEAPQEHTQAAKRVWDHYYANHQKAGHFRKLRVLDPFMGGGTTLVEGARLGFQMTGVDLNPVAWFVTKNELACSDPQQVRTFFDYIEAEVKPLVQPFYTTTCPRGHRGLWLDRETEETVDVEPLALPPDQRHRYRWEGPEVIYTFWAKHGPCQGTQAQPCGHRTPIFKSPVIAEKRLSASYIPTTCLTCGHTFNVELGETRMAPGVERVVLENEPSFTETSQPFAQLLKDYNKGASAEKRERLADLLSLVEQERGLQCPSCGAFAGHRLKAILERHTRASRISDLKKKDFGIESRHVHMSLLVHPAWLQGSPGTENGTELGGWAGADPHVTTDWWHARLANLVLIEVRGRIKLADEETEALGAEENEDAGEESAVEEDVEIEADRKKYGLPREIVLQDGTRIQTRVGTIPEKAHFRCEACGHKQNILEAVKPTGHTPPVAVYALQCHCPQCEEEGYTYGGRYFKAPEAYDLDRFARAEREWAERSTADLKNYWPKGELFPSYMTHRLNGGIPNWGYTHWWKMFNTRQLLVHAQLLRTITEAPDDRWPLDVREQALGAFQQYLRNQNMFCFWDLGYDKLVPMLSNANYHPKSLVVENSVFPALGRGNWQSATAIVAEGVEWMTEPWESALTLGSEKAKSVRIQMQDPISPASLFLSCGSSTDLSILGNELFDLVITDPPFGDNLFYADLADFFYVWLRIPLLKWYEGLPERAYFELPRTPHAIEAVQNPLEHPDDREEWEKDILIRREHLTTIRQLSGDESLQEKEPNPLYRPEPASDFYRQTLTACWAEANRLLKPAGLMAFTFHHSEDAPWVDVLEALFNAGYLLVATYPIRSDETKGESGAFGAKKIEYDIIHVCRKRLDEPEPVSWVKMRRWVKDETQRLKELLEHSHGKDLPEPDLRVILRGKALEFYSRHYGQVYTGDRTVLNVREALLGINQLLDDLLQGEDQNGKRRPPEVAEPVSRLFLQIFQGRVALSRDELHKTLRGTGIGDDLEARGWIRTVGTTVHVVPVVERFQYFTVPGRNRKVLKTDLDQVHFLIGASMPGSGIDVTAELDRETFHVKKSVDALLAWYAQMDPNPDVRQAARLAADLVSHWRTRPKPAVHEPQMNLFDRLEAEDA